MLRESGKIYKPLRFQVVIFIQELLSILSKSKTTTWWYQLKEKTYEISLKKKKKTYEQIK